MSRAAMLATGEATADALAGAVSSRTLVLFDLDGTITRRDTYLAYLLGFLTRHPAKLPRALPLPLAVAWHLAGLRDNTWLKTVFLRAVLGGVPRSSLEAWSQTFLDRVQNHGLRARAKEIIAKHRAAGDRLVLVTASLDFYAEPLAQQLGFDAVICTRAQYDAAGRITGELDGGNCYGDNKLRRVQAYIEKCSVRSPLIFYTDHHADLPLLRFVERPIAVNPTHRLRRIANELGIGIQDWEHA